MSLIIFVFAATLVTCLAPARAEPIKLKFAFFSTDRSSIYQNVIRPFVEAVNADGKGLLEIEMYFGTAISRDQALLPRLVAEGSADLSYIVPGVTPELFPDTAVVAHTVLFRDAFEASRVFTCLIAAGALKGYEPYHVVAALVLDNAAIHSRKPLTSNGGLKGLVVRVNNDVQRAILEKLGAKPLILPLNRVADAMSQDQIDAAVTTPLALIEFSIARTTTYDYVLRLGGIPVAIVMNRTTFDRLPDRAKAIIRKYSRSWLIDRAIAAFEALDRYLLDELRFRSNRKIVFPSPADAQEAEAARRTVLEEWGRASEHNRALIRRAQAKIAKLRDVD